MAENGSQPATKSDLDGVRTELKEEIQSVRTELKGDFKRAAMDQANMRGDIREMEQRITTKIDARHSDIMNAIDAFGRKAETYDRKAFSHGDQL